MGLFLSLLNVLGFGHVTVHEGGFEAKRCLQTARFTWDDVDEVYGTLSFGYGSFSIVLQGDKELQLGFDVGTTGLITAFQLRLPGFPQDWFSRLREISDPDDVILLWKKPVAAAAEESSIPKSASALECLLQAVNDRPY